MLGITFQQKPTHLFTADQTFTLADAPRNTALKLISIDGGRQVRHRLTELGLVPGVTLKIVQDQGGPILVAVHNTRLAIGRGMAQKIHVKLQ